MCDATHLTSSNTQSHDDIINQSTCPAIDNDCVVVLQSKVERVVYEGIVVSVCVIPLPSLDLQLQ